MTSRLVRLALVVLVPAMLVPNSAFASTDLSTQALAKVAMPTTTVFEINIKIPNVVAEKEIPAPQAPAPVKIVRTSSYNYPPKITGDARVYMSEAAIRAYVCPKLGDRCNTFIAILKAENGTHECTRDNRGLNRNGSVDIGLAQINYNPSWNPPYTFEQLQDCKFNLDIALQKVAARGFQPWYAYTKGAYLRHLPAVLASAKIIADTAAVEPVTTSELIN